MPFKNIFANNFSTDFSNIKDTIVYATAYIDFKVLFLLEMAYNNANVFASDQWLAK